MFNIGIIGPGRVAERHANALKIIPDAQLWSVAGRTQESAQKFVNEHNPAAKIYDNYKHMLNDPDLHAVIITTPDNLHADQIIECSKSGKAILVEKPVCTSIESAQQILNQLTATPVILSVAYHLRWHRGLRHIAMKAKNNELGKINKIKLRWGVNFIDHAKWRLDPVYGKWCCLSALGTHLIDVVRWILLPACGEVISSRIHSEYLPNTNVDAANSIRMQFASGAIAEIDCSLICDEPFSLIIETDKMNVHGDNLAGEIHERKLFVGNEQFIFEETNLYVEQLKAFIDAVRHDNSPEVSLAEGLRNVEILNGTCHERENYISYS